jgi:hypothetical protein
MFLALDGTEDFDKRAKFRAVPQDMAADAESVIGCRSKKDLNYGAHNGFTFGPGPRMERRLEIVAVVKFRQEAVRDHTIDESETVARIDEFRGREHP